MNDINVRFARIILDKSSFLDAEHIRNIINSHYPLIAQDSEYVYSYMGYGEYKKRLAKDDWTCSRTNLTGVLDRNYKYKKEYDIPAKIHSNRL